MNELFLAVQQGPGFDNVADVPRGHFQGMHQAGFAIDTDMGFAAEKPLIAFLAGMHLGVTRFVLGFGRSRRSNQAGVDESACS
ncbi:hypothetical protein A1353_10210 [Methylomonas methanica]|uniref:Uncharacterized protein n=1 Tax=Methylomonas methanica TaxID=421 RepID=A0A177MM92_METMH|nr:hypothetical protein A1353_10210 [Methylomonas methanica]